MACGVYSFVQASGERMFVRLTDEYAATQRRFSRVRPCDCDDQIDIETGRSLLAGRRREGVATGLGDVAASAIHIATLGMVEPCAGCKQRQELLNAWFPFQWRHEQ